ncbi:MAG: hypothetical protein C0626_05760 [Arcobacter sp.]|uniref:hypothetical protein n=1 Tax=uncultured Arcobacter sp. TaxID=165434 RepID=UPI000CC3C7A7|nr:hypothetical protein [uncultured Arcobacter sp.]PLY10481.1 MAG: hypothetical protein C0626_05760 [Arcobacter sp.]
MFKKICLGIVFLLFCYLYIFTGTHSDDIIHIVNLKDNLYELFINIFTTPLYLKGIPIIVYDFLQFYYFDFGSIYFDFIKILTSFSAFYIIYIFMNDYMKSSKAFLFSLIFILFPIHDATNYWTVGQYLIITLAFVMLSHRLIHKDKNIKGFLIGLLGSFSGYASPPFVFGLSIIFLLNKQYKKFITFLLPQIIYIIYYLVISKVFNTQTIKGSSDFSIVSLIKQFILQVGTFIDASIGPSFWLKIYYSIMQLTLFSMIIGVVLVILFYKYYKIEKEKTNKQLLIVLALVVLFAFGMFALTGMYPQIAFNLGNRVTIYGSLLISFLVVMLLMNNKKSATVVFSIFIFSSLGISNHWKMWNKTQLQVINNIKTNKDIQKFDRTKQLFVTYNQYSKLGDLSHIEFFAQGMATHIFKFATKEDYKVSTLNRRFVYRNSYLLDKKYGTKIDIDDTVYVYDSKLNELVEIKKEDIQEYIDTLPMDNRHWVQLLNKDNFIMKIVLKLMPRLEYAL